MINSSKIIKGTSHAILFGLSAILSINMFAQFSTKIIVKILFGLFALALECIKLYMYLLSKVDIKNTKNGFKTKLKDINFWKFLGKFSIYFGLAVISVMASVGFVLVTINQQSFVSTERNLDKNMLIEDLERNNDQLDMLMKDMESLPSNYVYTYEKRLREIDKLKKERDEIKLKLSELNKKQEGKEIRSDNIFDLLAVPLRMKGKNLMFYMMLLLTI